MLRAPLQFLLKICLLGMAFPFLNSCCSSSGPPSVPRKKFSSTRDVVYTPANWPVALRADVYRPEIGHPAPGVLLIHGGGWKGGDGRWQMTGIAKKLARHGYVVVNATYRTTPEFHYPAPLDDMREAIFWMRKQAASQGIDPARIATFGYSAGGHLAELVALKDEKHQARVKAIVAGGAPSDLTLYPGGDLVPAFLGGTQSEVPKIFKDASPVNHVSADSPPIFLFHASQDQLVPPEHALRMQAAYARYGKPPEIHWIPGRGHIGGFLFSGKAVDQAIGFLDQNLK